VKKPTRDHQILGKIALNSSLVVTHFCNECESQQRETNSVGRLIISIANNKGGTGKTTTAVNLGTALASAGRQVLLVDMDPQGSATVSFGFEKTKLLYTIYDVLAQSRKIEAVMLETRVENLTVVPSNLDLAGAEVELSSVRGREFVLREALDGAKRKFDVVLIDCPPNIGILTVNAIVACDLLMVPVQCEFYSMDGFPTLLKFIRMVKSRAKTDFDFLVLLTMYDGRTGLAKKIQRELREKFGDNVVKSVIPRSIKMAEAPSKGIPGILYSPTNKASLEYQRLAKDMLESNLADTVLTRLAS
jgi:chromosome partitioning protein